MSGLEADTIGGFNAMLKEQKAVEGEATITTVLFDDQYELLHDRLDIQAVAPLTEKDYTVRGSTALLDALGMTIHKIRNVQKAAVAEYRAAKVMFVIITDGEENASKKFKPKEIRKLVAHQQEKHGWKFIFIGANMDAVAEAGKLNIAAENAKNYIADSAGTCAAYADISKLSTAFRRSK